MHTCKDNAGAVHYIDLKGGSGTAMGKSGKNNTPTPLTRHLYPPTYTHNSSAISPQKLDTYTYPPPPHTPLCTCVPTAP